MGSESVNTALGRPGDFRWILGDLARKNRGIEGNPEHKGELGNRADVATENWTRRKIHLRNFWTILEIYSKTVGLDKRNIMLHEKPSLSQLESLGFVQDFRILLCSSASRK